MSLYSEEDVYDLRIKTHQISGRKSQSHVILKITLAYHKISANCVTHAAAAAAAAAAKSLPSCPTLRPHSRQPTRFRRPGDSPGKNTGVGCHFLLQCMKGKSESEVAQSYPTLCDPMDCSLPGSSVHGILQARVLEWGATAFSVTHAYIHTK